MSKVRKKRRRKNRGQKPVAEQPKPEPKNIETSEDQKLKDAELWLISNNFRFRTAERKYALMEFGQRFGEKVGYQYFLNDALRDLINRFIS